LPCLIRRSAFYAWGVTDKTRYIYADLSRDDKNHARHDDVRSAVMAIAAAKADGLSLWAGSALSTTLLGETTPYRKVVGRGLAELATFLKTFGLK
jgi:hypothetical protein